VISCPKFTQQADGTVTVDGWTPTVQVSLALLATAPADFLASDGLTLQFRVANGSAIYRRKDLVRGPRDGDCDTYVEAELVECDGPRKA